MINACFSLILVLFPCFDRNIQKVWNLVLDGVKPNGIMNLEQNPKLWTYLAKNVPNPSPNLEKVSFDSRTISKTELQMNPKPVTINWVGRLSQLYIFWIITYSNECQQKVLFYVFSSFTFHYLNFEFEFSDTFSRTLVRNKCYTNIAQQPTVLPSACLLQQQCDSKNFNWIF